MQSELGKSDMEMAYHCLRAVLYGPFIEESEFENRLGLPRKEMQQIAATWRSAEDLGPRSGIWPAVLSCMNEVCHGIRFSDQEWRFWFSESPGEIRQAYLNWERAARTEGSTQS